MSEGSSAALIRKMVERDIEVTRRIARYDEAVKLLREWIRPGKYPVSKTRAFLAGEPKP